MPRELEEGLFQALFEWFFNSRHPSVRWLQIIVVILPLAAFGLMFLLPESSPLRAWLGQWWWAGLGLGMIIALLLRLAEFFAAAWAGFRLSPRRRPGRR
jgi:hypothetical protein